MVLAEELRQAVIQQAIQGKLTRQLETDGSVDDYLEQISNKRAALIKNKEIRKEPVLTGYMNEKMQLQIPDSWRWEKLGNLCSKIGAGSTPKGGSVNYVAEGVPFIREQNVYSSGLLYSGMVYITEEMNELKAGSMVKPNDLLLNITGGSIGRCALTPDDFIIGNVNQHVLIIRLVDVAIVKYIHAVINSPYIQSQIREKSKGDKEGLSATSTKNFWIPIPPIEEQQRIVDKINEIMPKIDEYEKIEKELEALKKEFPTDMKDALLQAAMQGKLTEQLESDGSVDELLEAIRKEKEELVAQKKMKKENPLPDIENEEIPFDIPENWRWVRMGNIIKLTSGQDLQSNKYSENNIGIPYLTGASNFQAGNLVINRYTTSGTSIAYNGDLLLTCKGTIGEMAFINFEKAHIARQIMSISKIDDINLKYIKLCLENFLSKLKANARSIIPGIDRKTILNLLIPLPPIEEQQRIVERLEVMLPLCEDLREG